MREPPYVDGLNIDIEPDIEATIQTAREHVVAVEEVLSPDTTGTRRCSFAMNSRYGDDPPEDAILLFETEPGWNKVGGPEILSDQLTDPDGCFVYVNEHGVRFIPNEQVKRMKAAAHKAVREGRPLEFRLSALLKAIGE